MPVDWDVDATIKSVRAAAFRGVVVGTEILLNEQLRLILNTSKSGRIYRRRGIEHLASAPGEPPASDTGRLVQSARTDYDPIKIIGWTNFSTAYAAMLEYGTEKMQPRPYARPAVANKREEVTAAVMAEVNKVLG